MRKILILLTIIISVCFTFSIQTKADEIYIYPFDSIRITSAFMFEITIDQEPDEASVLYGQVFVGETLTIYVGTLQFVFEGAPVQGTSHMMIITTEAEEDIIAWIDNGGSVFASWIQISPDVGVIKDFTNGQIEIRYTYNEVDNTYTFVDNINFAYPMIADSLVVEADLDILVAAYVPEEVIE